MNTPTPTVLKIKSTPVTAAMKLAQSPAASDDDLRAIINNNEDKEAAEVALNRLVARQNTSALVS